MPGFFNAENAKKYAREGGLAKRESGFKQKARHWVTAHGFEKAIKWVNGKSDKRATFAMGLLFGYALGRPAEQIQIEDKRDILIHLASDPALNELAKRFGNLPDRVREIRPGSVVDGQLAIQTQGASTNGI